MNKPFDNDLFLLTTAVNLRYLLVFFPANIKQKVVRLLKSQVKNHKCRDTGQSGQVPLLPPNNPKAGVGKLQPAGQLRPLKGKSAARKHVNVAR